MLSMFIVFGVTLKSFEHRKYLHTHTHLPSTQVYKAFFFHVCIQQICMYGETKRVMSGKEKKKKYGMKNGGKIDCFGKTCKSGMIVNNCTKPLTSKSKVRTNTRSYDTIGMESIYICTSIYTVCCVNKRISPIKINFQNRNGLLCHIRSGWNEESMRTAPPERRRETNCNVIFIIYLYNRKWMGVHWLFRVFCTCKLDLRLNGVSFLFFIFYDVTMYELCDENYYYVLVQW